MSVLQLLLGTDLLGAPPAAIAPPRPAYGGYQFDLPAQATQTPMQQATASVMPQAAMPKGPSKLRNFLGAIGDSLLVANGGQPLYRQRMEQQRQQQALQGFLTNPDQAIAQLMQVDAPSAIALYKAVHPASETPVGTKEYEYEKSLSPDERSAYEHVLSITHPGMVAPITLGPGDTYDPGTGGAPSIGGVLPHVTDQKSYDAVPPGARYTTPDGKIRTKGGQTATPSGNFLDAVTGQNESGGKDFTAAGAPVTSSAGAKYAMQVLPSTARDPGFGVAPAQSDSPQEFNRVGREYRAALLDKYGGNLARMWAAYNMGPGALDNALAKYGDDWLSHVPKGVRAYVSKNLSAAGAL